MLKVRVIPTLLWKGLGLVKGIGFDSWRRVGPVLPAVKVYNARDVDELVVLDIAATPDGRAPDPDAISDLADACGVPLTVGGGISSDSQIAALLHAGADKVAINTAAYANPSLIDRSAARFGAQCVVASIDVRGSAEQGYRCFSHCGSVDTGRDPIDWAREMVARGAGEVLLTSIERDGTMQGYDLTLIERMAHAVDVPVVASGGAGACEHMVQACAAGAAAVAAASMFHFTELTPAMVKRALAGANVPVRREGGLS